MTLVGLIIRILIAAGLLTAVNYAIHKFKPSWIDVENWFMSFAQNFCGALFIFSGAVKAVDAWGTAFKLHDYFGEFEATAQGTWFSFLAPMFPFLDQYGLAFSIFMIVLEIALGFMLLLGYRKKLTAWLFFIIVLFFTALTGFTYLTGYVPEGANFFEFSKWVEFSKTNQKVTDCGCFGDFIKLEPFQSFMKDIFLLIPSVLFIIFYSKKHTLFSVNARRIITALATVGSLLFCFQNSLWDIPMVDFRPFAEGEHVRDLRQAEMDMVASAPIFFIYKDTISGEQKQFSMDEMANIPEGWEYVDRIQDEVKTTKLSDFNITDDTGADGTEAILAHEGYSLMLVAYKLKYKEVSQEIPYKDSLMVVDSIQTDTGMTAVVSYQVKDTTATVKNYIWEKGYIQPYAKLNPIMEAAEKAGAKVYGVTGPYDPNMLDEFRHEVQAAYPFYTADDILLKTIIRSNPGVVLWKDGQVVKKWHYKHIPPFEHIQKFMK